MIRFVLALVLADILLILPDRFAPGRWPQAALALELPLCLALLWLMPVRGRRIATVGAAAILVLALAIRIANSAIALAFDRAFDPFADLALVPAGWDLLVRSYGLLAAVAAAAVIVVILGLVGYALTRAIGILAAPPARHGAAITAALVLVVALTAAPTHWAAFPTARLLANATKTGITGVRAMAAFRGELHQDPAQATPDDRLFAALRGHDVLVVFVESYGRVALEDPHYTGIDQQLDAMTAHLSTAGFKTESAWLTSPTFGGESWYAHSTVLSGLWIDEPHRFDLLLDSQRPTLVRDFHRAGWRTVAVMPEITMDWPFGRYLAPDRAYDAPALDFHGQRFDYITMADQFALAALQTRELGVAGRPPVMAFVGLVSSHIPWTPVPKLVPWDQVGDGSIFDQAREGDDPYQVWSNRETVFTQYGRTISYDLATLESFVMTFGTDKTVLIVMGDHQPMAYISGEDASHDVPAHIIARDPAVIAAFAGWHWTDGMRPNSTSPVWRMDALRTRLVQTFSAPAP